jgi:hypothetical protein
MTTEPLFQVTNHHSPASGTPPRFDDTTPGQYRGYFENSYGEQVLFVYDLATRHGTLYLGDAGWETPHPVREGPVSDLLLAPDEQAWLRACWRAARAQARHWS